MKDQLDGFEKYAEALLGSDWRSSSEFLKLLATHVAKSASEGQRISESYLQQFLENDDMIRTIFPSSSLIQVLENLIFSRDIGSVGDESSTSTQSCLKNPEAYKDALRSYAFLQKGSREVVKSALSKFSKVTKDWSANEDKNLFSKWVECADEAHRNWILTSTFSKNYAVCWNYYFANVLRSERT